MLAACRGNVGVLEIMLFDEDFDTDINARDNNNRSAAMYLCSSGKLDALNIFLSAEPVPDMKAQVSLPCGQWHGPLAAA